MMYKIVCVRDRAVDAFAVPFFVKHVNEAIRSFKDEINREGSPLAAHPDDYDLYLVGGYDDQTGAINHFDVTMLAVGKSMVDTPF